MKILAYSIHGFDKASLEAAANNKHQLFVTEAPLNETTAHQAAGMDAIALFTSDKAHAEVLYLLKDLGVKYIALRSVGYDHVDLNTASKLGLRVANVPEYSPYAIAEHAVALLLAVNRKILLSQQLMQINDYRLDPLIGFDLHGKTVGVVGTGKIGSAFARIMLGFGSKVLGFDPVENDALKNLESFTYTTFEELCKASDVISICCPLNEHTRYMFHKGVFSLMKKGVVLINTARGGIVNTEDLLSAIDEGIVSAAGLDVYENEKPIFFFDHTGKRIPDNLYARLQSYPQVLITGHQAFLTHEALAGISDTTMQNCTQWEQLGYCDNDLIKS